MTISLNGFDLTLADLARLAQPPGHPVVLSAQGIERVKQSREVVFRALERGDTVYGLTTGLGSQVGTRLGNEDLSEFSYQTIRGRAHAIGKPLPIALVRGAMGVRLNTFLKGAAGADISVAQCLLDCLNNGLTPVVGDIGSIGAGDLCWGATMGLSLIGEGQMTTSTGETLDSSSAMVAAGMQPLKLGPKDGLVLANHSSFSGAMIGLNIIAARCLLWSVQAACAISMESFRANLSPLDPLASDLRPQPGQEKAAIHLHKLLNGSELYQPNRARRLQDPLSIRNSIQVHGAVLATLDFAQAAAIAEINGASDNPVVDVNRDRITSCGAYHTPLLTITAQSVSTSLVHVATTQLARISKMLTGRYTDLPQYLAAPGANSNGFAPVLKIAEALLAELTHAASLIPVWPSVNADGAEDVQTHAPLAIKALGKVVEAGEKLCAIELMVAAQAFELRAPSQPPPNIVKLVEKVRQHSPKLDTDRPLSKDIEAIANSLHHGSFTTETPEQN